VIGRRATDTSSSLTIFGTILAHSFARGPSVVQIRANDLSPDALQTILVAAIRSTEADLGKGALVTLDVDGPRIRLLPLE
jgi:predicted nuclease of predicted toxin-antitoxin system